MCERGTLICVKQLLIIRKVYIIVWLSTAIPNGTHMTTRGGRGSVQHIQLKMKNLQKVGRWGLFCCVINTVLKRTAWYFSVYHSPV